MSMQYLAVVVQGRRRAGARRTPSRSAGAQPSCGARPPSALNSKEAEQRTGDATLSDELHAEHREGRGDADACGAGGRTPSWSTSSEAYVRAPRWTSAAAKGATRSGSPGRAGA